MLSESYIHLPVVSNEGESLATATIEIERQLLAAFGGFTVAVARGAWRDQDTGKVYAEQVQRYSVAADWADSATKGKLVAIAENACRMMEQICVYVAMPCGVQFVENKRNAVAA